MAIPIHGNSNANSGDVSSFHSNITNMGVGEESPQILEWLSPLQPRTRHQDVSSSRLDGIGDWVLRRSEFELWRKGLDGLGNPTLLCYGSPGVGKTHISSLVIDTLRRQPREQNIAVLYLYCGYRAQKDQSAVNMIGGLLRQVASEGAEIPSEIRVAFEASRLRGGYGLRLPDMVELFVKSISSIERVYICVDAVDELLPWNLLEFLRALRQIIQDAPNARLFLTGRSHIRRELENFTEGAYILHIVTDHEDIARYIGQKTSHDRDRDPDLMTENLKNDILKTTLEKASEMFLLVALSIDAILGETSIADRIKMVKQAASGVGLDSVYDRKLLRIREQEGGRSRLGMEALMWVSHSERPLRTDELCHALAVEMESTDLGPKSILPQNTILGSCGGLVVIDKETSIVRLIHYTLQEYLSRPGILPGAHNILAETCLAYLNYYQVRGLPVDRFPNLLDMPFLQYSSTYWGAHAKIELSDRAKSLAMELLGGYDSHISAALLFNHIRGSDLPPVADRQFNALHCASYFGIVGVVDTLIEMKCYDINKRDGIGFTPFEWAARRGNEGVVRLLLTRGDASPSEPGEYGRTPLWWASMNGHEGVVRLLLERDDVNSDREDTDGQTPLRCASLSGNESVVRLLLGREDVDPDKPDNYGRTLLWHASGSGKKELVKLLLTRDDVDPDKPDNIGRTPLLIASTHGHREIVTLLQLRINEKSRMNL